MDDYERPQQKHHFDHGLLHYLVVFGAGLGLAWIIQSTYGPVAEGDVGFLAENLVVIFIAASVVAFVTKDFF